LHLPHFRKFIFASAVVSPHRTRTLGRKINEESPSVCKNGKFGFGFRDLPGVGGEDHRGAENPNLDWNGVVKETLMACPVCDTKVKEKMSSEAHRRIYHCPKCLAWLSTKKGDHCVYDSYGSIKCPRMQIKERRGRKLLT
jgi:hypothetical protein